MESTVKPVGQLEIIITDVDTGEVVSTETKNTVLTGGKSLLSQLLTNDYGSSDYYVDTMVFGSGGEDGNNPKAVDPSRTTLYNQTLAVAATGNWDSSTPTRARFTAVIGSGSANGTTINEAALRTADGNLFSMTTFSGLSKTSSLQFTLNWTIVFT